MQRGGVARATADYYRDVQRGHELHKVKGLDGLGDVLGGDNGTLNDEDVETGLDGGAVVAFHPLGRKAGGGDHALILYLLDAAED